jgi:hypothetical protein
MPYNPETVARVRAEFKERHHRAAQEADRRRLQLQREIPGLLELDREIASVGVRVFGCALSGGDVSAEVERMKQEHNALRERRASLLVQNG